MKNFFLITPLILFFFVISAFFYFLFIGHNPKDLPSALVKEQVPIFETITLLSDKKFISSEEFGHETTLVNFFASWCAPCRAEHTYINRLSKEKGIKIIGINFKDDPKLAIKWLKELGNPYSVVAIDSTGNIGFDWGVYGLPETFIVSKDSMIFYRQAGPITKNNYDDFYLKILESKK